jgi:hypothetical protein
MPMESRPILLLIDVEPDDRKTLAGRSGWESSEEALDRLESLRSKLGEATGRPARYNWFFRCDPQIATTFGSSDFVAEACPRLVRRAAAGDDAAGIHVHLWRWDERNSRWYNDFSDREWLSHCVDTSIAAFENMFGHRPRMVRFGDRWISQAAVNIAQEAGIRYDLTLEPGLPGERVHDDPHANGHLPDLRRALRTPYRPLRGDFLSERRDEMQHDDLWMIPVSTSSPQLRLVRRAPWLMRASRSPNLALPTHHVWPTLRKQLDSPARAPLVIVFRSGDLSNRSFRANFERTTSLLVRHPALAWCELTTPDDAIARWLADPD